MRDVLLQILEAIKALAPAETTPAETTPEEPAAEEPAAVETIPEVTETRNSATIAEEPIIRTTTKKRSVSK